MPRSLFTPSTVPVPAAPDRLLLFIQRAQLELVYARSETAGYRSMIRSASPCRPGIDRQCRSPRQARRWGANCARRSISILPASSRAATPAVSTCRARDHRDPRTTTTAPHREHPSCPG